MKCPRCGVVMGHALTGGNSPYRALFSLSKESCSECHGQWLPFASIPDILGALPSSINESWTKQQEVMTVADTLKLDCPDCGQPMDKVRNRANIMILYDRCLPCAGSWFDDGELEQIGIAIGDDTIDSDS